MKKILSIALLLTMLLSLAIVPASAAERNNVLTLDTVVDDRSHIFGQQHLTDDLDDHAQRTDHKIRPIGFYILHPSFQKRIIPFILK